ncbi:hypothetical protein APHAL10511_005306 [Amanita phalloides]|nr:hypothetical protein APHAL10511_005306 [Amanita phalloides]
MHSSPRILEDQRNTYDHFLKWRAHIEASAAGPDIPLGIARAAAGAQVLSDIVESILGAVFLDSRGDMSRGALCSGCAQAGDTGRVGVDCEDDVDVLHPVSRVSQWSRKKGGSQVQDGEAEGMVVCTILLDGEEIMVRRDQVPVLNDVASERMVLDERRAGGRRKSRCAESC